MTLSFTVYTENGHNGGVPPCYHNTLILSIKYDLPYLYINGGQEHFWIQKANNPD